MIESQAVLLPAAALAVDADRLHLGRRSREALRSVGILTLEQLADQGYVCPDAWDALGREGGKAASAAIRLLAAYCDGDKVDWSGFWRGQGVEIVPGEVTGGAGVPALLAAIPQLVHAALADEVPRGSDPERDWVIVDGRNGLVSAPKTLEELGSGALGVTRERVRQIEVRAMARLRRAFDESFHGTTYRLNESLDQALELVNAVARVTGGAIFEDELLSFLGVKSRQNDRGRRRLGFLLELMDLMRIDEDGERRPAVWVSAKDSFAKARVEMADRVGRLLTDETADAMTETDIVVELNRVRRFNLLSLANVRAAMPLCRVAEQLDDGRWQGRFECLSRRTDQAYRIISRAGEPLDLDLMAREINAKTRGRPFSIRTLSNQLSVDGRFVPIGKSGEWGLKTDHAADAAPIVEMMVEALRRAGRPIHSNEIQAAVEARRKVAKASVPMYLELRREFTRLVDGTWALSEWPEAAASPAPRRAPKLRVRHKPTLAERMEAVVVPYLQSGPGSDRELSEVVNYVHETLGVVTNTVYPYLTRIPGVERATADGRKVVRLVGPHGAPEGRGQTTLRSLIQAGETPEVEFKSTLRWDVNLGADNAGLQKMCTKTIAAFSNTNGGTLLIGVRPDGVICGIELDCAALRKEDDTCVDAFSRALAAIVSQHLGGAMAAQIHTQYQELDGKTVCVVDVPRSKEPIYLRDSKGIEFYVRSGTTSRALDLPEVAPYIRGHWS